MKDLDHEKSVFYVAWDIEIYNPILSKAIW